MDVSLIEQIKTYAKDVTLDAPLSQLTTFRVGGRAACLIRPTEEELIRLVHIFSKVREPYAIIGNGSNVVFDDEGFDGVVLLIGQNMSGITVTEDFMEVSSGTFLSEAANRAKDEGLSGLEFASGIPGTIGGAIFMNAGAYGHEMKDIVHSVRVVDRDGNVRIYDRNALKLSYRSSRFSEETHTDAPLTPPEVVLSVKLSLTPGKKEEIEGTMRELMEKRKASQPLDHPSAGSAFKRPEGFFAGKLIEDAGLKGFSIGDAAVSEKHAGFIINKGSAKASEIKKLRDIIIERVKEQFKVELVPEIRFAGKPRLRSE